MKVDIWSDVRCPFCYIGKRRFETALAKFSDKDDVEVVWHSFELDPNLQTNPGMSTVEYFKEIKNIPEDQARQMFRNTEKMAAETGIEMDIDSSVLANSFQAHRLIQLSKEKGIANDLEEALFKAHFAEGKNIDDPEVLIELALTVGIGRPEAEKALTSEDYAYAVKQDIMQAQQIGVQGVPFFVFEDKYAVSGAQSSEAFLEVLEKVRKEKAE